MNGYHTNLLFRFLIFLISITSFTTSNKVFYNSFLTKSSIDPCYDDNRPRKCMPDFVNAAFGQTIEASSICGSKISQQFCDIGANRQSCDYCDDSVPGKRYPASALTDVHNSNNVTCWRSEPRLKNLADVTPDNVTLTLSLGKKYEITYVSLTFCPHAIRPDSIAIYKSMDYGRTWVPYQFYSSQCRKLYGRPFKMTITKQNEQEARCIDHFRSVQGDMSGIQSSRIAFSTLEGRPSAQDFESSPLLQDWVTATDIKVVFHRLHSPVTYVTNPMYKSQKSKYSGEFIISKEMPTTVTTSPSSPAQQTTSPVTATTYSLSDFAVGGRCKCNGHASKCIKGRDGQLTCDCRHNTAGRECERCKMFYYDRPWGRATTRDANECKGKCIYFSSLSFYRSFLAYLEFITIEEGISLLDKQQERH